MITLAFAQMAFYLVNSMKAYGGDEGLPLPQRAELGLGLDLGNEVVFYYVALLFLALSLYGLHRVMQSRFGRVVIAIRENEARAEAIGLPVYRYQLACFVFVGVVATDDVSLEVKSGEVHALIGPNGAGKTTLISQISGSLPSDRGEIRFDGQDITRARPYERVKLGLARSYQITSIFKRFTVLDNLALAVQARSGSSFSFWRPVSRETALSDEARTIAGEVGLQEKQNALAATLAHGEQRALEVGLALATRPKLVPLDEPLAGMGPEEAQRMIGLIDRVRSRVTVLLVEHDMDAVFRLANRISVLVNGRLIASGAPEAIKADEQVRKAYLGDEVAA